MKTPFLVGDRVYLRPLEREDLNERYLGWLNDPEVNRHLESGIVPYTKRALETFYEQVTGSRNQVIFAIAEKETDQHIGNVKLGPIDWISRRATFGLLIGDRRFWRHGIGKEVTRLVVEYGFCRLNLNKIDLGVVVDNEAAIRCYSAVGFQVEGRLRQHVFKWGRFTDSLRMGLLRSEYAGSESSGG